MKLHLKEELKYIDKEADIVDYGTGDVSEKDIFDNRTHVSFYDDLFNDPQYMKDKYNLVGEIKMMSPNEYFDDCAKYIFHGASRTDIERSRRASKNVLSQIRDIIFKYGKRVFLPYINYAQKQQEGLHRMMVAGDAFGWDTKFPVLVVNWYDKERVKSDAEKKEREKFERAINQALSKALNYSYRDFDEFKDELLWKLDTQLQYFDDYPFNIDIYLDGDNAIVDIEDIIKYKFNPSGITYKTVDETNIDEIDIDEDELNNTFIDDIDFNV